MKRNVKTLLMILVLIITLSVPQLTAFADTEPADTEEFSPSVTASWFCELVGDEEVPSSSDSAVFSLVSALTVEGEDTKAYIETNAPYISLTLDGKPYGKAHFVYDEERDSGLAASTLYGYGSFKGVVCANEDDTLIVAKNADATNDSVFTLESNEEGVRIKSSVILDGSTVEGVWNRLTGMPNFKDVLPKDWFYRSVAEAYQKGLLTGKTPEYFEPESNMTFIEAITLAVRVHSKLYGNEIDTTLNEGDLWYQPYLTYAEENGIPHQFTDLNEDISRADFISILYYACPPEKLLEIKYVPDGSIPDVTMDMEGADKIYAFYRAGLISGCDELGYFYPESDIKRCEVATVINNIV